MTRYDAELTERYRKWYLCACERCPVLLKWMMRTLVVLCFILIGPIESLWRVLEEIGRAYRNFSLYRALNVWRHLGSEWRRQAAEIEEVRARMAKETS